MPTTAAPADFVGGLPGTQGLPPVVQQLGHEVSPMAAPGLVVARVRSVEAPTAASIPAPRRPGRTAQRQASTSIAAEPAPAYEPEPLAMPMAAAAPVVARSSSTSPSPTSSPVVARSDAPDSSAIDGGDDDEVDAGSMAAPEMSPVRSLPTVSRSAIRVPDRPLTSAASVVRAPVQRSHAGHQHAAPTADTSSPAPAPSLPVPSGGMRRAQSSTVISRSSMPTVSRQATSTPTPGPTPPGSASSTTEAAPLPALAPSSRRGVGEPTMLPAAARPIGAPASPIVSRSTMSGPMRLASSTLRTTVQREEGDDEGEDEGDAPVQRSVSAPVLARTAAPALPSLPSLPSLPVLVARSARGAAHTPASDAPATSAAAAATSIGAAVQRSTAPSMRPIAAHNPLRPSIPLQREADDDEGDDDTGLASPWWAPAGEGSPTLATLPVSGGGESGPAVQRSAFTTPTAAPMPGVVAGASGNRSAASGPAWSTQNLQRSARSSTPARLPLAVQPTPASAGASAAPGATPDWSAPGTTVVFPQRSITSDPVVQTSRAPGAPSPSSPSVQRDPATAATSTAAASSTGAAAGATAAKAVPSERDLDELAKQLFGRIRTRLRADLLHDREASGFTFDNV